MKATLIRLDRALGSLVGLATGDALGTTLEFRRPGTLSIRLSAWFQPEDQLRRYVRWYREGHHSSIGRCFDIGTTIREALHACEAHGDARRSGLT